MADFDAYLGNNNGVVMVFGVRQTGGEQYPSFYINDLEENASSSEPSRKEATAHSQGLYANTPEQRVRIERLIKENITKIGGNYTFRKEFWFNQTLSRGAALDYITADDINGLLAHASSERMTELTGGAPLIDGLLGGT